MAAIRTFDPKGVPVALGKELGRGGEGAVYDIQGRPDSVAKVYLQPPNLAHGEKLVTMAAMAEPNLLRLAAWPTSTLHGPSRSVVGFVMPKVTGHSPVFKLYGPKLRLQEFPKADWRFLIQAAANAARAFSTIHAAGLVIGDVNHGNLVVGPDATMRLIDCDSFQVSNGARRWLCEVGVGTHQPPEMQALPSYAGVTRTPNHDNFGLAVVIFQMLCMGRHPFAGRYLGNGESPSIEEAVAHCQYAYARDRQQTMMAPPPGSLPIDALTPDLQNLFEAAFARSASNRPTADRWVTALQQLGSRLRECSRNQAHHYVSKLAQCPWCQIEAASGTPLFPVVFIGNPGDTMGIAALWQDVTRISAPLPLPPFPDLQRTAPSPSPAVLAAARAGQRLRVASYGTIAAALLAALTLPPPALRAYLVVTVIALLAAIILKDKSAAAATPEARRLAAVKHDLDRLRSDWQMPLSGDDLTSIRRGLDALKAKYDDLPVQRAKRLQELSEQRRQKQLEDHLDRFPIALAGIQGVGPAKAAMLSSHGINTAGDIENSKVLRVPGFGPVTTNKLVAWRQAREREFRFDPSRAVGQSEIATVERDIAMLRRSLEQDMASGVGRLKAVTASANARRQALEDRAAELLPRYAQAAADVRAMPGDPTTDKGVFALAGVTAGVVLMTLISSKIPHAGSPAIAASQLTAPAMLSPPQSLVDPPQPPVMASARVVPVPEPQPQPSPEPAPVHNPHVVTRQAVNLREAPNNTSQVLRAVPQGAILVAYTRRDGWVQVGDDMPRGWVYSGFLRDAP